MTASLSAKWTHTVSNEKLQRSSQAVSVVGQKVHIFGGELLPREPVDNRIDIITLAPGQEAPVQTSAHPGSSAPTPRVGSPSATLNNDSIWIFSGRGGLEMKPVEEHGALWRYQTTTGQWALVKPADPAAPFPAGRSYHSIASDRSNRIYLHAGCPESGRLSDLWVFDVKQSAWTQLPSAPAPPRGGTSIAFTGGKLYRMNGFDGKTELGGSLDVFDEATSSWSTISYKPDGKEGPGPRSVATLLTVTISGKAFLVTLFGEGEPSALGHAGAGNMMPDAWAWDIQELRWRLLEFASGGGPQPRGWFDADVGQDSEGRDTIVVHGGLNHENQRLGDVWELSVQ